MKYASLALMPFVLNSKHTHCQALASVVQHHHVLSPMSTSASASASTNRFFSLRHIGGSSVSTSFTTTTATNVKRVTTTSRLLSSASSSSDDDAHADEGTSANDSRNRKSWKVFWDLECPFARKNWEQYPALKEAFGSSDSSSSSLQQQQQQFDMTIHLTSLAFHPRAWIGQCAAFLIRRELGDGDDETTTAWHTFIDACYQNQHLYKDNLDKDARPSEVAAVFADIAEGANLFATTTTTTTTTESPAFTREYFLEHVMDWNEVIKPTYQEHKYALEQGVFGTPKHVIDGQLVLDTESTWGVKEWQEKLQSMGYIEAD